MTPFWTWIGQGFGIGRIPFAPGTFGSALGFAWLYLLAAPRSVTFFWIGAIAGALLAIPICSRAERALGKKDPGSVVMDEWIAIPFCYLPWTLTLSPGAPMPEALASPFSSKSITLALAVFFLFRLFDIWKPWPARQVQSCPGGWGIVLDDLLAAIYTSIAAGWASRWLT